METFFRYNWMVREEWYQLFEGVSEEDLLKKRTGGLGSILETLFHIVEVEWSWIRLMQGKTAFERSFDSYRRLELIRQLDAEYRPEVKNFVKNWDDSMENRLYYETQPDGSVYIDAWGEIIRHTIAHQIHHIGQLSIWAREIGKEPVSPNLLGRGLVPKPNNK